ncbi:hypothetical protein FIBSPDRAFT_1019528 [Athelia psychrophila]|uniref:DNA 3'-5' helicase n=1 Tax=Athelia psychrophila TaxID=1759441 RepID=A0A166KAH6_9AGAM|nr:hypothetical protein FIBSPDRAFT_1019528 [Fibularhizoctonia sp. CBS 109695]
MDIDNIPTLCWQDPIGLETIQLIIGMKVPQWGRLYDWQLPLVARILDGECVLCCTATSDGKSALFGAPAVIAVEISAHPELYPDLPRREKPVSLVITPTKGLSANIVYELEQLGIKALSYCNEVLTEARKTGRKLAKEIGDCEWTVTCVDPEHFSEKEWHTITDNPLFRSNLFQSSVDEAHLINEWGDEFRLKFKLIGSFLRGRLPPNHSICTLTATLQPGEPTESVCKSLDFLPGKFYEFRRSNERPNLQFVLEVLTFGLGGDEFPDLLAYLRLNRKTVIYCESIGLSSRVYMYLLGLLPPGHERLQRIRMYHALCWPGHNEKIVQDLREDPYCQIVIATIAFGQGFNIKTLQDSIILGAPATADLTEQERGRAGRDHTQPARGIVLYQPRARADAFKYIQALGAPLPPPGESDKAKKPPKPIKMDHAKALYLTENHCLISCMNRIYGNGNEGDCITTNRTLPCTHCQNREPQNVAFPAFPLPPDGPPLAPFPEIESPEPVKRAKRNPLLLSPKERSQAESRLLQFEQTVWVTQKAADTHGYRPRSSYFSRPVINSILDVQLTIKTIQDLESVVSRWPFFTQLGQELLQVVQELNGNIEVARSKADEARKAKLRETYAAKKALAAAQNKPPTPPPTERSTRKRPALKTLHRHRLRIQQLLSGLHISQGNEGTLTQSL